MGFSEHHLPAERTDQCNAANTCKGINESTWQISHAGNAHASPLMRPVIHPRLSTECMKSADGCLESGVGVGVVDGR